VLKRNEYQLGYAATITDSALRRSGTDAVKMVKDLIARQLRQVAASNNWQIGPIEYQVSQDPTIRGEVIYGYCSYIKKGRRKADYPIDWGKGNESFIVSQGE